MMKKTLLLAFLSLVCQNAYSQTDGPNIIFAVNNKDEGIFVDLNGKTLFDNSFEEVMAFRNGLAPVKENGMWGTINSSGRIVTPCRFEEPPFFNNNLAAICENGKWGFMNPSGKIVIPCKYSQVSPFYEKIAAVNINGKWGFIDEEDNMIIPCQFDEVGKNGDFQQIFTRTLSNRIANGSEQKWNSSNEQEDIGNEFCGTTLYEKWYYGYGFMDGLATVSINNKWGVINKTGQFIITCQYDNAYIIGESIIVYNAPVNEYGAIYGVYDKNGKLIIPVKFANIWDCGNGLFITEEVGGKTIFLYDKNGKKLGQFQNTLPWNSGALSWEEWIYGMYAVLGQNGYGVINDSGRLVLPCAYQYAWISRGGYITMQNSSGKWGVADKYGNTIMMCTYNEPVLFSSGLASIEKNGKYGYMNLYGQIVIPCVYDDADQFFGDVAIVEQNGEQLLINKKNEVLARGQLQIGFVAGEVKKAMYGRIRSGNKVGIFDKKGIVIPATQLSYVYGEDVFFAMDEYGWKFEIDKYGLVKVQVDGGWSVLDVNTKKLIFPPIADDYRCISWSDVGNDIKSQMKSLMKSLRYSLTITSPDR